MYRVNQTKKKIIIIKIKRLSRPFQETMFWHCRGNNDNHRQVSFGVFVLSLNVVSGLNSEPV